MKKTMLSSMVPALLLGLLLVACSENEQGESSSADKAVGEVSTAEPAATSVQQSSVAAADAVSDLHPGQRLHDANCISCHDSKVYTRENRKAGDFMQLAAQVRRCDANLGTGLFDDELEQITTFLNQTYYHYEQ